MILHTVNRSPFGSNCLQSCLDIAAPGSAIILIEDGVYGALADSDLSVEILAAMDKHTFYVLGPDLLARGIQNSVLEQIESVDYSGFVTLCTQYDKVVSWY